MKTNCEVYEKLAYYCENEVGRLSLKWYYFLNPRYHCILHTWGIINMFWKEEIFNKQEIIADRDKRIEELEREIRRIKLALS